MFEVGRLVARITLEGADQVTRQLGGLRTEWTSMSKSAQQAARDIGGPMLLAGGSLIAILALVTKAAIDWESAWAGVTKTVEGTPRQMAAIEQGLRGLARILPASHEEIAAVAEAAGQLGVKSQNVVQFTRTMIDLGETTNLSADQAATALARFMNIMGTSQSDVRQLGSAVVDLGNKYAATEAEIVEMAQRLAGAGVQVGLSEGQVLGLATALASVGIEAEAGGSAMSRVMIKIAAAVDQGGEQMEKFAKVAGLSADEFAEKWRTKPGEALALFVQGLANAEEQGTTTLSMLEELGITEIRMRDALLRSAAASDLFTEAMQTGNQAFAEGTALQDEAAKRYATLKAQIEITGNAINDAAIDFGQVFMPAVAKAAEMIRQFAGFLGDLPPSLQGAIGVFTLLTGTVLLFGGALLLTIPKIVQFRAAVAILTAEMPATAAAMKGLAAFLTGPWGVALAAAVAGVLLLRDYIQSLEATTEEWQNTIKNARSASDLFKLEDEGRLLGKLQEGTLLAETFVEKLDLIATNPFATGFDQQATTLRASLQGIGEQLAITAEEDLPAAQAAFRLITEEMGLNEEQQLQLLEQMPLYREALIGVADQQGINVTTGTELQNTEALLKLAFGESESASRSAAEAYLETTTQVDTLADELDKLIEKLMEANGQNISAVDANARYQESLAKVSTEIDRQRDAFIQAHGSADGFSASLDENTVEGAANAAMLAQVAQDAQTAARAQFEVDIRTMGAKKATELYVQRLQEGRNKLIDSANAAGFNAGQVQNLTDRVYAMPTAREIRIMADTSSARARLDDLLWSYQNRTITLRAYIHAVEGFSAGGFAFQEGGFAFPGMNRSRLRETHIAQIARAGTTRIWNEAETEGEVYIPLSKRKRARSTAYLEQTADMFGYDLVPKGGPVGGGTEATKFTREAVQHVTEVIELHLDGRVLTRSIRDYERSIS